MSVYDDEVAERSREKMSAGLRELALLHPPKPPCRHDWIWEAATSYYFCRFCGIIGVPDRCLA